MVIDSDLPPVPRVSFDELLLECIDALVTPSMEGAGREIHLLLLDEASKEPSHSEHLQETLKEVADIFRNPGSINPDHDPSSPKARAESLAAALSQELGQAGPRYIFHGTIWGRLAGIANEGLVPGRFTVWNDDVASRKYCDSAVFFTASWRRAVWWADAAHHCSRGRRDSKHRTPVIIRISADGLRLEPDQRAVFPGCLMVRSTVSLVDPHVISGQFSGFPIWRPLAEVLATK
ncbi:MAG: hypothetical protein Q8O35_04150 [Humidesulfovibrio sp.]|uniref:hypothetical protein n=1 Tax=Humidesulfovibrio sp. TaxID=2910988 RepID=UPI00273650AE|nr:hypothetical protein [Humidesulfovibrio sp.]MDP2847365.1 hypothetical protein [Humidesulfovibrio sp.]